jgi:glycosyltransferase involved in cell wall biosynthesis
LSAPPEAAATAAHIIATLQPRRIAIAEGAPLRPALAAAGVALTAADGEADLAIAEPGAPPASFRAARVLACAPEGALRPWLEEVAAAGFRPVVDYDAHFLAPTAVLLLRARAAPGPAMLDVFAGLLGTRIALQRREQALASEQQNAEQRIARLAEAYRHADRVGAGLRDRLAVTEARLALALYERDAVSNATLWRASRPLRRLIDAVRPRRAAADAARAQPGTTAYQLWVEQHDTPGDAGRAAMRAHIEQFHASPVISVVMPVYDPDPAQLRAAIVSVRAQLYPHWQLCIADDASPSPQVAEVLREQAAEEPRIRLAFCARNGNISAATNAALAMADGAFVALMDHDDLLPERALYEIAAELDLHPDADILYSDEDQIDGKGKRTQPYFKPDWNIDLMLAHNLISHLGVYRRSLVEQVGGMRLGYEGSQDYDLALRIADVTEPDRIRHIPSVLYHWRQHQTSFSNARRDACIAAARRAIADHLARAGVAEQTQIGPVPTIPDWTRVRYALPDPAPRVSIIVPTRDKAELLSRCMQGLLHETDYPDIEVIIADNGSHEPQTAALFAQLCRDPRVRVLECPGPFNYSAINNAAVACATGPLIALVNNDIEVIEPGWLAEMAAQALRPEIGAVGARLLFPDRTVQHAGVVLGVGSFDGGPGVAGHFSLHDEAASHGYFGASALVHEVSAVTAACMVLRKQLWDEVGGLDAAALPVAFNDVDLCLRLRARGLRILWTPFAELIHHESASRGDDLAPEHRARFESECRTMRNRWGPTLDRDPFYNSNFSRSDGNFRLGGLRQPPWL